MRACTVLRSATIPERMFAGTCLVGGAGAEAGVEVGADVVVAVVVAVVVCVGSLARLVFL